MRIFGTSGFSRDRSAVPPGVPASVERALFRYKRMLPQVVFDAGALEGSPFTFPKFRLCSMALRSADTGCPTKCRS